VNLVDKHLLTEIQESNRHLIRSLRLFNKYFLKRHSISLVIDQKKYPDTILKDLRALYNFSNSIIGALEGDKSDETPRKKYQQLELTFNKLPKENYK